MNYSRLLIPVFLLAGFSQNVNGQIFRKGNPELFYSQSQLAAIPCVSMPMVIDASLTIIKDWYYDPNNQLALWSSPSGIDWYVGGTVANKDFFYARNYEAEAYDQTSKPQMWIGANTRTQKIAHLNKNYSGADCTTPCDATADAVAFISNVYQISASNNNGNPYAYLLGFVHIERTNVLGFGSEQADRRYAIGIAYSANNGTTWTYAGDVIRPAYDALGDGYASNIGGIPYVVVNEGGEDYFYVYYNEHVNAASRWYPSVARVKVADATAQAVSGTVDVSKWKKLANTASPSWTEPGLTGTGKPILPWVINVPDITAYDMHSDAAYCAPLKKYFLLANKVEWDAPLPGGNLWRKLSLLTSSDAVNWSSGTDVDSSYVPGSQYTLYQGVSPYEPFYGSFVSNDIGASDDSHVIGREFSVIYSRKLRVQSPSGAYSHGLAGDLYGRKIKADPDLTPIRSLLLD
jgi:hypothetical protein